MNMDERIARINELYHKSQAEGLTEEEKAEQARLRREYVDNIRNNLKSQLDNIVIERPDGSVVDLGKKYGEKADGQEPDVKEADGQKTDGQEPGVKEAERQIPDRQQPDRQDAGVNEADGDVSEAGYQHG